MKSRLSLAAAALSMLAAVSCVNASVATDTEAVADSIPHPAPADTATLLFVGDAMQHSPQFKAALRAGCGREYDYSECFSLIAPEVSEADYAVVNLEVPLDGEPYSGYPCFSAPDAYAQALRDAGFDLFLTANNHTMDRGTRGVRRTIAALDSLGVDHTGTWTSPEKRAPLLKSISGIKTAFLNYTYGTNGIPVRGGVEVSLIDRRAIADEIAASRRDGAEFVIVTVHWGNEYEMVPNATQRELARYMIGRGADMIIGSHPHVVQPMMVERDDSTNRDILVAYSLGNFLSNQTRPDTRGGAMVRARIVRDVDGTVRLDTASCDLHFTAKPSGNPARNYRVVPSWMPDSVPAGQRGERDRFEREARRIFTLNNRRIPLASPSKK